MKLQKILKKYRTFFMWLTVGILVLVDGKVSMTQYFCTWLALILTLILETDGSSEKESEE